MIYAGIGRRNCPLKIQNVMTKFAQKMDRLGWTLRSGGAQGSDAAFAQGATKKEIFEKGKAEPWALEELKQCLPCYLKNIDLLANYIQNTIARNMMIILGKEGNEPVQFVMSYADTFDAGGTGYGYRCAKRHHIPVFNLFEEKTFLLVESFLILDEDDGRDFIAFIK